MPVLHRIGILFLSKLLAISIALAGLITGVLYAFVGLAYDAFTTGLNLGTALAFLAIIAMPLLFSAAGFVVGAIGALLYNLSVRFLPGIASDIEAR